MPNNNMGKSLLLLSLMFFGSLMFVFTVNAADCIPVASSQAKCGASGNNFDAQKSYICMPMAEKVSCEDTGGQLINDDTIYPDCAGPTIGCCVAPICEDVTGSKSTAADTGTKPVPQTGSTAEWDYNTGGSGIRLVACTKTGDCSIKDMVQQGIYVADFLIGISGALFLIAFIWGGAMYLLSFGRSEWVTKGRNAMVKSMIGIVFIILAWTIVTFVAESLGYKGL